MVVACAPCDVGMGDSMGHAGGAKEGQGSSNFCINTKNCVLNITENLDFRQLSVMVSWDICAFSSHTYQCLLNSEGNIMISG